MSKIEGKTAMFRRLVQEGKSVAEAQEVSQVSKSTVQVQLYLLRKQGVNIEAFKNKKEDTKE